MAIQKAERGRPADAKMDSKSIQEKIEFELLRANKNAANNLKKYFETLDAYALGEKGSDTNIISSAKYMIEMATNYLEECQVEDEEDEPAADNTPVQQSASLVSFDVAKKA